MHLDVCEVAGSTETETEQVAKKVMTAAVKTVPEVAVGPRSESLKSPAGKPRTSPIGALTDHANPAERAPRLTERCRDPRVGSGGEEHLRKAGQPCPAPPALRGARAVPARTGRREPPGPVCLRKGRRGKAPLPPAAPSTTAGPRTLRGGDERDIISDLFSAPPRSDKQSTAAAKRCLGRNFSGHEPLPRAASRPRPGARKESPARGGGGRAPAPARRPPGRAAERLPEFSCRGAGGQTDTNKSSARHARGPRDRPATEGCPPALPLREGTDTVPPLCPTTLHPLGAPRHRPGTQRSGHRCPPIARASRGVQAAAAPGWRSAGIRRQRLLLPRRPVPPAPALRWAGREGGRWEPAERRFLLPGAEGRRVPEPPPRGLRRRLSRGRW
ncbi:uncharacterized protein LOC143693752 [Agelaius phoeniceus]|uniref:uncharacterized protein LOC143693752 n=1 Tax=Agelaius phoeniceus TaxID=39638 RepID=UPI004054B065